MTVSLGHVNSSCCRYGINSANETCDLVSEHFWLSRISNSLAELPPRYHILLHHEAYEESQDSLCFSF